MPRVFLVIFGKSVIALAAIFLMSMSAAYAKSKHGALVNKSSVCLSHSYEMEALFKCDQDEFIAPIFSVTRSLCHGEDTGIAIAEFNNGSGGGTYLLAKKIARSCSHPPYEKWADSRRCPQLIAVAKSKDRFALPRQRLASDREIGRLMDGSFFTLEVEGFYPKERTSVGVTLTGQDNSPVGRWVETALKVLEPCWSDKRPPR